MNFESLSTAQSAFIVALILICITFIVGFIGFVYAYVYHKYITERQKNKELKNFLMIDDHE